jgi:hypothetical protein
MWTNFEFLKQNLIEVTEPQTKRQPAGEQSGICSVDFAATPQQWSAIQPELQRRGIQACVYDNPGRLVQVERAEERHVARQNRRQSLLLLMGLGVVLGILGFYITMALTRNVVLAGGVGLIGLVVFAWAGMTIDTARDAARQSDDPLPDGEEAGDRSTSDAVSERSEHEPRYDRG